MKATIYRTSDGRWRWVTRHYDSDGDFPTDAMAIKDWQDTCRQEFGDTPVHVVADRRPDERDL